MYGTGTRGAEPLRRKGSRAWGWTLDTPAGRVGHGRAVALQGLRPAGLGHGRRPCAAHAAQARKRRSCWCCSSRRSRRNAPSEASRTATRASTASELRLGGGAPRPEQSRPRHAARRSKRAQRATQQRERSEQRWQSEAERSRAKRGGVPAAKVGRRFFPSTHLALLYIYFRVFRHS